MFGYGNKLMSGARYYGKKAFNLGRKGLKYGIGAGLLIGSGYLGAKVHTSLTDEGDAPEPGRALPGQSIEDIFSGPLGSGEFEERRTRRRREAVSNIEPQDFFLEERNRPPVIPFRAVDDDGFPNLVFRE